MSGDPDRFTRLVARLERRMPAGDFPRFGSVLAVSGGGDSVALAEVIATIWQQAAVPVSERRPLVAAYIHHGTAEADAAEAVAGQTASRLGLPFFVARVAIPPRGSGHGGQSWEGLARQARRSALIAIAHDVAARYVFLGHTADDQTETMLHRMLRGTGVAGLGGMRPITRWTDAVTLVRPLLTTSRRRLRRILEERGCPFRDDPTNVDRTLMRGRLRQDVVPVLEAVAGGRLRRRMRELAADADQTTRLIDFLAETFGHDLVAVEGNRLVIGPDRGSARIRASGMSPRDEVALITVCLRRAWRAMGWPEQSMTRRHWTTLSHMVCGHRAAPPLDRRSKPIRPTTWPGGVVLVSEGDRLILSRISPSPPSAAPW